jgi:hypothetical protein
MDKNQIEIAEEQGKSLLALQQRQAVIDSTRVTLPYKNPYQDENDTTRKMLKRLPKGIDIIQEFELIQQKKSKLSRWQRDMIERIFNSIYKKADQ